MEEKNDVQVLEENAVVDNQSGFFTVIERLASNPDVDVEKIQRIIDMQSQILDKNAKQAFNASMVRAQSKMPIVPKDKTNDQTHSKYSGYETILKYCQPVYTAEGFSVSFSQGFGTTEHPLADGFNRIVADVMHEAGYTKTVFVDIPVETTGPKGGVVMTRTHATGSGFTYGRSYLIRLIFNIPTGDDDDGNSASDVKYIDKKQISAIEKLMKDKSVDSKKFLAFMGVESLDKISTKNLDKAMKALKDKKPTRVPGQEG